MIGSSLTLITQALAKLGIDASVSPPFDPVLSQQIPIAQDTGVSDTTSLGYETFNVGEDFQTPQLHSFNPDSYEISPEMLDAFSSLEPIDATVGALRNMDWS